MELQIKSCSLLLGVAWRANASYFYIAKELWTYFNETEAYSLKPGEALNGFMPDWIGEFYAYYPWYYDMPSRDVIKKVPLGFLKKAYFGLHDLELDLAVQKVVHDKIWGIGLSMKDPKRFDRAKWRGQNLLGYTLMVVRDKPYS